MTTQAINYVNQRIDELNNQDHDSHKANQKLAVTLRLTGDEISVADRVCEELSLSRQAFLSGITYAAVIDAAQTLADLQPEKKRHAYYMKLMGGSK